MQTNSEQPIVVVVSSLQPEAEIRAYATILTQRRPAKIRCVSALASDPFVVPWGYCQNTNGNTLLGESVCPPDADTKIELIVSEWLEDPEDMQEVLQQGHRLHVPVVIVRNQGTRPSRHILVATAGGPNVLQMMWVAREVAQTMQLPVQLLRIVQKNAVAGNDCTAALDASTCRLLRINAEIEVQRAEGVEDAIVDRVKEGDMLVLGAPSSLTIARSFARSLPSQIANRLNAPVLLLSMPPEKKISLHGLLWGDLIQTQARFNNKNEALSSLIDNLVRHNHIPITDRADMLNRALRREAIMPTAMDCETAFPHIALNGFSGITGCMAICPEGVDFGSPDGHMTRFIFLLVTPDHFYDDYLATVAMLARRMIRTETRAALLQCRTPADVLDVLEPEANSAPDAETPPPSRSGDFARQTSILQIPVTE